MRIELIVEKDRLANYNDSVTSRIIRLKRNTDELTLFATHTPQAIRMRRLRMLHKASGERFADIGQILKG